MHGEICVEKSILYIAQYTTALQLVFAGQGCCEILFSDSLTCSIGKPGVGQVGNAHGQDHWELGLSAKKTKSMEADLPTIIPRGLKLSHVPRRQ